MDFGYTALRESAAWLDRSARGRIRVTGDDRARLLHAMTTNHIEQLQPGQGCYAFFLNAQGRILADLRVFCFADHLLLDTEPETRAFCREHLDKYIIADDVTLEDVTDQTFELSIEGPRAAEVLDREGITVPGAPWEHAPWGAATIVRTSGFAILGPIAQKDAWTLILAGTGIAEASAEADRIVRLEQARPRYGEDFSDKHLLHETQLFDAVHFNKGCYLGQEIVERIRSRGGVHRFLTGLRIESAEAPPPGTPVTTQGRDVGEIASAAYSPAWNAVAALAWLRTGEFAKDAPLEAAGRPARITASKPVGPAGA